MSDLLWDQPRFRFSFTIVKTLDIKPLAQGEKGFEM